MCSHMVALDGPFWKHPGKEELSSDRRGNTFLAHGFQIHEGLPAQPFWYFADWAGGSKHAYKQHPAGVANIVTEHLTLSANTLLTHQALQDSQGQCIILVSHRVGLGNISVHVENWHLKPKEYFQAEELHKEHSVNLNDKINISRHWEGDFQVSTSADTRDYRIDWNLIDVNEDGKVDLVGSLTAHGNTELKVAVFPGLNDSDRPTAIASTRGYPLWGFDNPVVSGLGISKDVTNFFAAPFMKTLVTHNVDYKYPNTTDKVSKAGLLTFFDNLGILGARMAAPVFQNGSGFRYEIKGQTPAIAGQTSRGLGWEKVMAWGFNSSPEPQRLIGILPLKT